MPGEYEDLRRDAPSSVVSSVDGKPARLIVRYEDVRSVLADEHLSTDKAHPAYPLQNRFFGTAKPVEERTFFDMDNPDHGLYRPMFNPNFTAKAVNDFVPHIQAIIDDRLDILEQAGSGSDLNEVFSIALPTRALAAIIGVPWADFDWLQQRTNLLVSLTTPSAEATSASQQVLDYFLDLVDRKRAEPGEDMISRVIASDVEAGTITPVQLASSCRVLLIAGFETTASMITLGTLTLLQHPDQLAAFKESDDAGAARAVEELVRYLAVAHVGRRRVALADIPLSDGDVIHEGEGVIVATDAGDHDPAAASDPDRFDITRRGRPIVSFGFGIHQCIGQNLARTELRLALRTLFRRFPDLRLAVPVEQLVFDQQAMAFRVRSLPVTW